MNRISRSIIAALMALTVVASALAVPLNTFPTFLAKVEAGVSTPDYLIVVGSRAKPIDVVAAIDLASTLASLSYQEKTVTAAPTAEVTGKSYELYFGESFADEKATLTATHIPYFWRGDLTYEEETYYTYEKLTFATGDLKATNDINNGTMYLTITKNDPISYEYVFSQAFNETVSETKPLVIKLFGKEYNIIGYDDKSITILTGVVGVADPTTPVKYAGYEFYAVDGETGKWVKVQVKDAEGNVVASDIYDMETKAAIEFTLDGKVIKVKALSIYASPITSTVTAKLVVGEEVDKKISEGDTFPEEPWVLKDVKYTTASGLTGIEIVYRPEEEVKLKIDEKITSPNDYFEIGVYGLGVTTFATLTFEPVTGIDVKDETTNKVVAEDLFGLKISSDIPVFRNEESKAAYYLLNSSHYVIAYQIGDEIYYDKIAELKATTATGFAETINVKYEETNFDIVFNSYNTTVDGPLTLRNVTITEPITGGKVLAFAYQNTTSSIQLGAEAEEAKASDVKYDTTTLGEKDFTVTTDYGFEIVDIKTNADADKVVLKVPSERQKLLAYAGKLGAVTEAGVTYKELIPITTSLAKLDTEVTDADKTTYNLVLVGGPCVNTLVQDLVDAGKLDANYTCAGGVPGAAWTTDTAYILTVDDAFTTGKVALIVAGYAGKDTRAAVSVLQNYATKLKDITAGSVKIDTSVITAPVVTALE